jgi:hypothetical protein
VSFSFFQALFHANQTEPAEGGASKKIPCGSPSQKEHDGDYFTHSRQKSKSKKFILTTKRRETPVSAHTHRPCAQSTLSF